MSVNRFCLIFVLQDDRLMRLCIGDESPLFQRPISRAAAPLRVPHRRRGFQGALQGEQAHGRHVVVDDVPAEQAVVSARNRTI